MSTKMLSMSSTGCSSSNQQAVISAERKGLSGGKQIDSKMETIWHTNDDFLGTPGDAGMGSAVKSGPCIFECVELLSASRRGSPSERTNTINVARHHHERKPNAVKNGLLNKFRQIFSRRRLHKCFLSFFSLFFS